jgi:hypothetical protein
MSTSTTAMTTSTSVFATRGFWEFFWRTAGIQSIVLAIIAQIIHGHQPLVAEVFFGLAILNLMWFAAALRTTLAEVGQDGWGSAATASSAVVGGFFLLLTALDAALGSTSELNGLAWSGVVVSSFPRAMLIMAGTFGLWRAKLISNALFATGVGAVVLVLLGGSTWLTEGFWSPDGGYSRFVSPIIGLLWVAFVSRILLTKSPAARAGW